MKKSKTLIEFFSNYPYKAIDSLNPRPYIKKEEINNNHMYSCTYREYCEIIFYLIEIMFEKILNGEEVKMPNNLGYFKLIKYKSGNAIDWNLTNQLFGEHNKNSSDKKFIYHKNNHTDQFRLALVWKKTRSKFKNKTFAKFKLSRGKNKEMSKAFNENINLIGLIDKT